MNRRLVRVVILSGVVIVTHLLRSVTLRCLDSTTGTRPGHWLTARDFWGLESDR